MFRKFLEVVNGLSFEMQRIAWGDFAVSRIGGYLIVNFGDSGNIRNSRFGI